MEEYLSPEEHARAKLAAEAKDNWCAAVLLKWHTAVNDYVPVSDQWNAIKKQELGTQNPVFLEALRLWARTMEATIEMVEKACKADGCRIDFWSLRNPIFDFRILLGEVEDPDQDLEQ